MRVPLNSFLFHDGSRCYLNVGKSMNNATSETPNQSIIIGGQFFEEFQAVFTNTYTPVSTNETQADQKAVIYTNAKARYTPYVGDEVLPPGDNPFIDQFLPLQFNAEIESTNYLLLTQA
jgi:hypothetical protein